MLSYTVSVLVFTPSPEASVEHMGLVYPLKLRFRAKLKF